MILQNPVRGTIHPDAHYYPTAPGAFKRPAGDHTPLVTQDFGPTTVADEPTVAWAGGESNIYGITIPKGIYPDFHPAIDISTADCGRDVLAMGAGRVARASRNPSGAFVVEIDHGMVGGHHFVTGYVHLPGLGVVVGQLVKAGQVIGKIGNTGISTACHIHAYVEKDGLRVDLWRRLAQNTSVDPDAPAKEADVPVLSSYIPGHVAVIANAAGAVNVRAEPSLTAPNLRQIPAGESARWVVTGWVKGDLAAGSDQWICAWAGNGWEYTHKVNVLSVTAPATAATDQLLARLAAKDAAFATITSSAASGKSA